MNSELANDVIFKIDNNPEILKFKLCNGFLIWARFRYEIYRTLIEYEEKIEISLPVIKNNKLKSFVNKLKSYLLVLSKSPLLKRNRYDCLIFNSSISCYEDLDGKFKSKINNFTEGIPGLKTLNIFQSISGIYKSTYNKPFAYHEAIYLQSNLEAKFFSHVSQEDFDLLDRFIDFLKQEIGDLLKKSAYIKLESDFISFIELQDILKNKYCQLFKRTKPKFIIVEDGNYGGGDKAILIWCANNLGIKTIEVQHGVFDLAFRYGENLTTNYDFAKYKTSLVLTMGKFWSEYCKLPSKVYSFGYPYLEKKLENLDYKNKIILFISQGKVTNSLKSFALQIAPMVNYDVVYRLHPAENLNDYCELKSAGITLSGSGDIYQLMADAVAIIGSYSTVLFEAMLFDKFIFIHDNVYSKEFIPAKLGIRFTTVEDILLKLSESKEVFSDKKEFWALDWKKNMNNINQLEKLW